MMVTPIGQVVAIPICELQSVHFCEQPSKPRSSAGEFPHSVLLFPLVPGDPESGAVYILDRKTGTWDSVDFDDKQYGGYSVSQLEQLLKECHFLDLAERPGLWRGSLN
jgi:hypothetical protein